MKPTEEQIKKFWEWCGFKYDHWGDDNFIIYPDDKVPRAVQPLIDLNNLFKYAVPKVLKEHSIIETYSFGTSRGIYYSETCIWDGDDEQLKGKLISKSWLEGVDLEEIEALTRFWAIYKVMEE